MLAGPTAAAVEAGTGVDNLGTAPGVAAAHIPHNQQEQPAQPSFQAACHLQQQKPCSCRPAASAAVVVLSRDWKLALQATSQKQNKMMHIETLRNKHNCIAYAFAIT
jgi:hypothetical protein